VAAGNAIAARLDHDDDVPTLPGESGQGAGVA
jgi:hypothetical protein